MNTSHNTILLIVDAQNDFCSPDGALYVPGAEEDMNRLAQFIEREGQEIDSIIMTQDHHHVLDIAHPGFWRNKEGKTPEPFISISAEQVENGEWIPIVAKEKVKAYLKDLDKQGEFAHVVWPEHCIMGSVGEAIYEDIFNAVNNWARQGNYFQLWSKGDHPLTEHFGALRANIPIKDEPATHLNQDLVDQLKAATRIIVGGEARSHCIASTVKQLLELDNLDAQLILLNDCMSPVAGFEQQGMNIFIEAVKKGARWMNSSELKLND